LDWRALKCAIERLDYGDLAKIITILIQHYEILASKLISGF